MMSSQAAQKPDIEFRRQISPGTYRTYGHIYWKPFIVHILGRTIWGKRTLKRLWEEAPKPRKDGQDE